MADIPEDVQQQAYSATQAIRSRVDAVEHTGNVTFPQNTPNPELAEKVGKKVADLQRLGYDADELNKELTKNDFVRE